MSPPDKQVTVAASGIGRDHDTAAEGLYSVPSAMQGGMLSSVTAAQDVLGDYLQVGGTD